MALYQGFTNWHDHCLTNTEPTEKWLREDALTSIVDLLARSLGEANAGGRVVVWAGADRNASRVGFLLRLPTQAENGFGSQSILSNHGLSAILEPCSFVRNAGCRKCARHLTMRVCATVRDASDRHLPNERCRDTHGRGSVGRCWHIRATAGSRITPTAASPDDVFHTIRVSKPS